MSPLTNLGNQMVSHQL